MPKGLVVFFSFIIFLVAQDGNRAPQKQTLKSELFDSREARNQVIRCRNIIAYYVTQKWKGTKVTEEDRIMTINYQGIDISFIIRQGRRFIIRAQDPATPDAFKLTIYDNNADGRIDYFVALNNKKTRTSSSISLIRELSPIFYQYMQNLIEWDEEETKRRIKEERDFFNSVLTRLKGGA